VVFQIPSAALPAEQLAKPIDRAAAAMVAVNLAAMAAANPAAMVAGEIEEATGTAPSGRCMMSSARTVVNLHRFPSSHAKIALSIAKTATNGIAVGELTSPHSLRRPQAK